MPNTLSPCIARALLALVLAASVGCERDEGPPPLRSPQLRGVIEGFYGEPYSFEDRTHLFASLPTHGFDAYYYGPKDDPLHRDAFREPYPEAHLAHFADLVARGRSLGVRFVFTLSPGLSYDPETDFDALAAKLDALADVGVRDFCLFFDDLLPTSPGADPDVLVDIVIRTRRHLRARDAGASLCVTPPYYFGTAEALATDGVTIAPLALDAPSSAHYAAYARLPRDVALFWTGPGIFTHTLTTEHVTSFRAFVGREVLLWDNFPVNDTVLSDELFLGPYMGRTAALGAIVDGVVLNLAREPRASRIAIATAGDALRDGATYDPAASHAAIMTSLGGDVSASLARLAEHCASHPLVAGADESARFAALVDAFLADRSAAARDALGEELARLAAVHDDLAAGLPDPRLFAELADHAAKLSALAEAALALLDAYDAALLGEPIDLAMADTLASEALGRGPIVGANTHLPAFLARILGDGAPAMSVDVWGTFLPALRALVVDVADDG